MRVNSQQRTQQVVSSAKEHVQAAKEVATSAAKGVAQGARKAVDTVSDSFSSGGRALSILGDGLASNGGRALQGLGDQSRRLVSQGERSIRDLVNNGGAALDRAREGADRAVQSGQEFINDSLEKLDRLSDAEKRFLVTNPLLAAPFNHAADRADELATQYSNQNLQGDENNTSIYGDGAANAIRHATWNALMVREAHRNPTTLGNLDTAVDKAKGLADAHEDNPRNTNQLNKEMDLHNNDVGRQVAEEVLRNNPNASEEEIFQAVVKAYEDGRLREVSNGQLTTAQ